MALYAWRDDDNQPPDDETEEQQVTTSRSHPSYSENTMDDFFIAVGKAITKLRMAVSGYYKLLSFSYTTAMDRRVCYNERQLAHANTCFYMLPLLPLP